MPSFSGDVLDPSYTHGDLLLQCAGRAAGDVRSAVERLLGDLSGWRVRWRIEGFRNENRAEGGRPLSAVRVGGQAVAKGEARCSPPVGEFLELCTDVARPVRRGEPAQLVHRFHPQPVPATAADHEMPGPDVPHESAHEVVRRRPEAAFRPAGQQDAGTGARCGGDRLPEFLGEPDPADAVPGPVRQLHRPQLRLHLLARCVLDDGERPSREPADSRGGRAPRRGHRHTIHRVRHEDPVVRRQRRPALLTRAARHLRPEPEISQTYSCRVGVMPVQGQGVTTERSPHTWQATVAVTPRAGAGGLAGGCDPKWCGSPHQCGPPVTGFGAGAWPGCTGMAGAPYWAAWAVNMPW
ncbi:hypothetical protein [Streptomyces sp. NPDC060198]|uniref:hypothetical protein n=1 Tax=Streptomyces sp. NPDC060198 TaxID=3347070 RepID=UPI00365B8629